MSRRSGRLTVQEIIERVGTSYWFVPSVMLVSALILAAVTLVLDYVFFYDLISLSLITGSADAAHELLSTLAGATITVAGVVFSIMIVALSLASQQFGPRLLRNFMRDRGNQVVIGMFLGSFVFHLAVLSQIRGDSDEVQAFVPSISLIASLLLGVITFFLLIYFIHHMIVMIQVENIIKLVSDDLNKTIDSSYPTGDNSPQRQPSDEESARLEKEEQADRVSIGQPGYIELIDHKQLVKLATQNDLLLRLCYRAGDFVLAGTVAVLVWPRERIDNEQRKTITDSFVIHHRRTPEQDVEFCITQLVQIACRALSPALNDPFTAIACIDTLSASLARLLDRQLRTPWHFDEAGKLRMVTDVTQFPGLLGAAFHAVRQSAASNAAASIALIQALGKLARMARRDEDRDAIHQHTEMVAETILRCDNLEASDREKIRRRTNEALGREP